MRFTETLSPNVGWFSNAAPLGCQPVRPSSKSQFSGASPRSSGSGNCASHFGPDSTWMTKDFVLLFPELSVATHVTTFEPRGKKDPDGGVQTTVGFGSTASVAVTP